jgi:hypothetical protein
MYEFENDPVSKALNASLELQEAICEIHPKQGWVCKALVKSIDWLVDLAITLQVTNKKDSAIGIQIKNHKPNL